MLKAELRKAPSWLIKRAAHALTRQAEAQLRPLGLGMASLPVLTALKNGEAATQAELARLLQVEQPSMAQTLARLERDQLILRSPSAAGKRAQIVEATALGRERLAQAIPVMAAGNARALAGFSPEEEAVLASLLQRVCANLGDAP